MTKIRRRRSVLNSLTPFTPIPGQTLRQQLEGHVLAGPEAIRLIRRTRRNKSGFIPPKHWDYPSNGDQGVCLFSITKIKAPGSSFAIHTGSVKGICWTPDGNLTDHRRLLFQEDVLDHVVGEDWSPEDLILLEENGGLSTR